MSRILQALKQLESRPAEAAVVPAPAASEALPPETPVSATPTVMLTPPAAPTEPPAPPRMTEPITPRRKRRQVRRTAAATAAETAAAAEATALEIEQLLTSLQPGVIECWQEHSPEAAAVVQASGDELGPSPEPVIVQDFLPEVIQVERVVEPTPPPTAAPPMMQADVLECWHDEAEVLPALVMPAPADEEILASESIVVRDFVPEVIQVAELSSAPQSIELEVAGPSEVELEFQPALPRRVKREPVRHARSRRERARAVAQQREVEVRTIVRGPRALALAKVSAWETNIHADLEDPQIAAPLEQLLARWQQERAGAGTASLLVASLAAPMMAAEVALRAATLLTRQDDAAVLVIDADPDAAFSRRLGITGKPGLSELLSPSDAHGETIHPTATPRLHVLPRGRSGWPASATLADVSQLLDDLGREYTWLLVTTGDAASAAAQAFARACRGAYVVAPLGQAEAASAEHQISLLRSAGARILGALAIE